MSTPFLKNQDITIYYFSGTGNTQIIANKIIERFQTNGFPAKAIRIEEAGQVEIRENGIIGIGFPVVIFSTYPVVLNFIKNLPTVNAVPVFVFCTMGGSSLGGIKGELKTILAKKGYLPVGYKEFKMPVNIFINMPEKMKRNRIHRGFFQANRFVDMLIKGKTHWRKIPLVSRFMFYFNSGLFKLAELQIHQKIFKIRIEHDKCNKCGLCVKKCPARNISLDSKVIIGNKCQYCFRCVAVCPIKATFGILSPKSLHYKAENASF